MIPRRTVLTAMAGGLATWLLPPAKGHRRTTSPSLLYGYGYLRGGY